MTEPMSDTRLMEIRANEDYCRDHFPDQLLATKELHLAMDDRRDLLAEVERLHLELRDTIHDEFCGGGSPGQEGNCKPRCLELSRLIGEHP